MLRARTGRAAGARGESAPLLSVALGEGEAGGGGHLPKTEAAILLATAALAVDAEVGRRLVRML